MIRRKHLLGVAAVTFATGLGSVATVGKVQASTPTHGHLRIYAYSGQDLGLTSGMFGSPTARVHTATCDNSKHLRGSIKWLKLLISLRTPISEPGKGVAPCTD